MKRKIEKKGVSLMLSYILLISLGIFMAAALYGILQYVVNIEPVVSCESGTSLIILQYSCGSKLFKMEMHNNGKFSIPGFIVQVGESAGRVPVTPLNALAKDNQGVGDGTYIFVPALDPGASVWSEFDVSKLSLNEIKRVRIQPFILSETQDIVVCSDAVIIEDLKSCVIQ